MGRCDWMVMRCLLIILAISMATGCNAPWEGPTPPDSGHPLSLTALATHGPYAPDEDILASTSLAALRMQVIARALNRSGQTEAQVCSPDGQEDLCWRQEVDRAGLLYLAVITPNLCNVDVKEAAAISGHTLSFIRWIGKPKGVCNAAMMLQSWRLFSASRADLPSSGTLTVQLQLQGTTDRVAAKTQVELT